MRKVVLSAVAAVGLAIVGTFVVTHPTAAVRQADAAPVATCTMPHGQPAMADAGHGNRPQRVLVAGNGQPGLAHSLLVSDERDSGARPQAVMASDVQQVPPC